MDLKEVLKERQAGFHPIVSYDPERESLYPFDFTETNEELRPEQIADTESFAAWINGVLSSHHCKFGIGGYGEHRTLYARSSHFDGNNRLRPGASAISAEEPQSGTLSFTSGAAGNDASKEEPRRLHLGIDIWGPAGTKIFSPLDGLVHSFAFNNKDSDYGATLILVHSLGGIGFYTLYGHLSLNSIRNLQEGRHIRQGEVIGEFGMRFENGNWPPHLHFQLIRDMQGWKGDYPGVCKFTEKTKWLDNCPDPDLILQLNRYLKVRI